MNREIYIVEAYIVDANGTFNPLTGYPMTFDSKNYNHDLEKTRQRAYGQWHQALADMSKNDARELQVAGILRMSDGLQIERARYGALKPLLDSEQEN